MFLRISTSSFFGHYNYVVYSAVFTVFLNKIGRESLVVSIPVCLFVCFFLTGGHSGSTVPETDSAFLCWGKEPAVK